MKRLKGGFFKSLMFVGLSVALSGSAFAGCGLFGGVFAVSTNKYSGVATFKNGSLSIVKDDGDTVTGTYTVDPKLCTMQIDFFDSEFGRGRSFEKDDNEHGNDDEHGNDSKPIVYRLSALIRSGRYISANMITAKDFVASRLFYVIAPMPAS